MISVVVALVLSGFPLPGSTPAADDQVLVADSTSAATWRGVPDCGEAGTLNYTASTNTFSCLTDDSGGGGGLVTNILTTQVDCSVSASYCTIWSHTPATASRGVFIRAFIIIDSNSATVAPQFRVSSADTGYTGICTWQLHAAAAATTTAPVYDNIAIGTAPADTADTAWIDLPKIAQLHCALLADASPGAILIEWQLETGTSPTQNVLAGSYMTASN